MKENFVFIELDNSISIAFNVSKQLIPYTQRNIAMHEHNGFELHILFSGTAQIETTTASYTLNEKDIALIPPNVYHSITNKTDSFELYCLAFFLFSHPKGKTSDFVRVLQSYPANDIIILERTEDIFQLIKKLQYELQCFLPYRDLLIKGTAEMIIVYLFRALLENRKRHQDNAAHSIPVSNQQTQLINAERSYIIEGYFASSYQTASIDELSAQLGLSNQHVRRLLQKEYGLTFTQMLTRHRIETARKLLLETDLSITAISIRVGFNSPQRFSVAFKNYSGLSPFEYKKKKGQNP